MSGGSRSFSLCEHACSAPARFARSGYRIPKAAPPAPIVADDSPPTTEEATACGRRGATAAADGARWPVSGTSSSACGRTATAGGPRAAPRRRTAPARAPRRAAARRRHLRRSAAARGSVQRTAAARRRDCAPGGRRRRSAGAPRSRSPPPERRGRRRRRTRPNWHEAPERTSRGRRGGEPARRKGNLSTWMNEAYLSSLFGQLVERPGDVHVVRAMAQPRPIRRTGRRTRAVVGRRERRAREGVRRRRRTAHRYYAYVGLATNAPPPAPGLPRRRRASSSPTASTSRRGPSRRVGSATDREADVASVRGRGRERPPARRPRRQRAACSPRRRASIDRADAAAAHARGKALRWGRGGGSIREYGQRCKSARSGASIAHFAAPAAAAAADAPAARWRRAVKA